MHLVRNALDHGIEPADERQAHGKPREGSITLVATSTGFFSSQVTGLIPDRAYDYR